MGVTLTRLYDGFITKLRQIFYTGINLSIDCFYGGFINKLYTCVSVFNTLLLVLAIELKPKVKMNKS